MCFPSGKENALLTLKDIFSEPVCDTDRFFSSSDDSSKNSALVRLRPFSEYVMRRISVQVKDCAEFLCPGALRQSVSTYILHLNKALSEIITDNDPVTYSDWQNLFSQYPAAERMALCWTENFTDYITEVVRAFCESFPELEKLGISPDHGRLRRFFTHDSDIHEGKYVIMLETENGDRFVYKPRSDDTDELLEKLSSILTEEACMSPLHFPRRLRIRGGTFYEYIQSRPVENDDGFAGYYEHFGFLMFIMMLLGACDYHSENIIADREYPLAIDTETSASEFLPGTEGIQVSKTAMLPFLSLDHGYTEISDAATGINGVSKNLPRDTEGNVRTGYEYRSSLEHGFRLAYETALKCRDRLRGSQDLKKHFRCHIRYLFQNTYYYERLLNYKRQKQFLTEDKIPDRIEEILFRAQKSRNIPEQMESAVIGSEQTAMLSGYIPKVTVFYSDTENNPLYDAFLERLNLLSPEHLENQIYYIHTVLHPGKTSDGSERTIPVDISGTPVILERSRISDLAEDIFWRHLISYRSEKNPIILHTGSHGHRYYVSDGVPVMPECSFGILPAAAAWSMYAGSETAKELAALVSESVLRSFGENRPSLFQDGLTEGKGGILLLSELMCGLGYKDVFEPVRKSYTDAITARSGRRDAMLRYSSGSLFCGMAGLIPPLLRIQSSDTPKVTDAVTHFADVIIKDTTPVLLNASDGFGIGFADRILSLLLCHDVLSQESAPEVDRIAESVISGNEKINDFASAVLSLYSGKYAADILPECPGCENLHFGNALLLTALSENGYGNESRQMAERMLDRMEKKRYAGLTLLGEPSDTLFPSFFHGYGGVLYAVLRAYEPSFPAVFKDTLNHTA